MADVLGVLAEIGAGGQDGAPLIEAWNKVDLLDADSLEFHQNEALRRDDVALCSALGGGGVGALSALIVSRLTAAHRLREIAVGAGDGAAIAWLHSHGKVERESLHGDKVNVSVRLSDADYARFASMSGEPQ
jgi:GTPase